MEHVISNPTDADRDERDLASATTERQPEFDLDAERARLSRTNILTPERQAYDMLHWGFVAAPVIAGLDKFTQILANWDAYLAPSIANIFGDASAVRGFMMVVGVVEIAAGLLVAVRPRIGAYVVAGWLAGIILNLLIGAHYFDIALRDLGLCLGALALGRLAQVYDVRKVVRRRSQLAPAT